MSPMQQKIMQYLPVVFAVFLVFYLTGLVVYYMAQAIFRIGLQYYITHRFYKGEQSLGRQAQAAGERAREIAKKDGGGGGMFAQARRELAAAKESKGGASARPGVDVHGEQAGHAAEEQADASRGGRAGRTQDRVAPVDRRHRRRGRRRSRRRSEMEWVETTARTVEEAKEQALDQLGVAEDDAEFEVLDEPRAGLFGRVRGEARVRARVRPTQPRPKVGARQSAPQGSRVSATSVGAPAAAGSVATAGSDAPAAPRRRERPRRGAARTTAGAIAASGDPSGRPERKQWTQSRSARRHGDSCRDWSTPSVSPGRQAVRRTATTRGGRRRHRPRSARRTPRDHAAGGAGDRPRRLAAPPRRPRHPAAGRRRRLPRAAPRGAGAVRDAGRGRGRRDRHARAASSRCRRPTAR